jgi:putative ABC transport system permease protein
VLGAFDAVLFSTAAEIGGDDGRNLSSATALITGFNGVTAVVLISSVSTLTVALQRRSHALWQLVGVSPLRVGGIVLGQVVVLSALCGTAGVLVAVPLAQPAFELLSSTFDGMGAHGYRASFPLAAALWTVGIVVAVSLAGSLRGAIRAARVRPIEGLHDTEWKQARMGWLRWVMLGVILVAGTPIVASIAFLPEDSSMGAIPLVGPLLTGVFAVFSPVLLPLIVRGWTAVVPARWSVSWFLARANALHKLSVSTSVVSPILTAAALVGGLLSSFATMGNAILIELGRRPADPPLAEMIILLGGPVVLAAIGASMTVAMSGRSRSRDLALLAVAGGTRGSAILASVFESLIYAVTAALGAMLVILAQAGLSVALLSVWISGVYASFEFGPVLLVSAAGLVLVAGATVGPVVLRFARGGIGIRQLAAE